jgi:YD repeat-containing protein
MQDKERLPGIDPIYNAAASVDPGQRQWKQTYHALSSVILI